MTNKPNPIAISRRLSAANALLQKIADALGTAETNASLVEVARDAHKAEQREAHFLKLIDNDYPFNLAFKEVYGDRYNK